MWSVDEDGVTIRVWEGGERRLTCFGFLETGKQARERETNEKEE